MSKDWFVWNQYNQYNVSNWSDMSTHAGLSFQWASTIKKNITRRFRLVQSGQQHHLVEYKIVLAMISVKDFYLVVNQSINQFVYKLT